MDSLLQRGEKLDDLVQRSDQLSMQSKLFHKTAKQTNACCTYVWNVWIIKKKFTVTPKWAMLQNEWEAKPKMSDAHFVDLDYSLDDSSLTTRVIKSSNACLNDKKFIIIIFKSPFKITSRPVKDIIFSVDINNSIFKNTLPLVFNSRHFFILT